MPYEGTLEEDKKLPGVQRFSTSTSDNNFEIFRVDLRYIPKYNPDVALTTSALSGLYDKASRQYNRQVIKGKLLSEGNVMFAGSPARAALYKGFDDYHQLPTHIETVWVWHGDAIYLFTCSYTLPETEGSVADKKQFLMSVRFEDAVVKEL